MQARAKWWVTRAYAHSSVCALTHLFEVGGCTKKNACVPAAGDCLVGRQLTPRAHILVRDLDFGGWVSPPLPKAELDHIFLDNHSIGLALPWRVSQT